MLRLVLHNLLIIWVLSLSLMSNLKADFGVECFPTQFFGVSRALLSYFGPSMGVYIYTFRIKFLYGVLKVLKLNIGLDYKRG